MVIWSDLCTLPPLAGEIANGLCEWLHTTFELKGLYWMPVEFKGQDGKKCFQVTRKGKP